MAINDQISCLVCDSNDLYQRYSRFKDYEYHVPIHPDLLQCRQCGFIRQKDLPTYEDLPALYPDDYLVYNASFRQASNALYSQIKSYISSRKAQKIARNVGYSGRVLDVGCANGALLLNLKQVGDYELHGLDIKNTGVDFEQHGIHFQEGSLESSDYPDNHFDTIVIDNLIEHVPELNPFTARLLSLLKPGGRLFGMTPNFRSLDRMVFGEYWGGFHMPRHIYLFSSTNLPLYLEKQGFVDVHLPVTANSGDWAVSVQNFMRRNQEKTGKYRRAPYFPVVGIALAPVAYVSSLFHLNGVMEFVARKPD